LKASPVISLRVVNDQSDIVLPLCRVVFMMRRMYCIRGRRFGAKGVYELIQSTFNNVTWNADATCCTKNKQILLSGCYSLASVIGLDRAKFCAGKVHMQEVS